jgi:hypothetical protein
MLSQDNKFFDNASFAVLKKESLNGKKITEKMISNGIELENPNYLTDHDIFHWVVDSGLFHAEYSTKTDKILEKEISTSFHGEGLIEIFSRFFGNIEAETFKKYDENNHLIGEYIKMPKIQKGVKVDQPYRTFPLKINNSGNKGKMEEYQKSLDSTKRYTIIGSLISGEILSKFLDFNSGLFVASRFAEQSYYLSMDFKMQVFNYIANPYTNKTNILILLDEFLHCHYNSSLNLAIETVDKYITAFYEVFLPKESCIEIDDFILFSILDDFGNTNLLGEIFYINRSLNIVHNDKPPQEYEQNESIELQNIKSKIRVLESYKSKSLQSKNFEIAKKLDLKIFDFRLLLQNEINNLKNKKILDQYTYFGFCRLP